MTDRKKAPEGGVERYVAGRDGRTLLAIDKKGNELIVTQDRDKVLGDATKRTQGRADALNKQLREQRENGLRRD